MIPQLVTDPIEVTFENGQAYTLRHGLGRPVLGWLVIWRTGTGDLYVVDATADTREALVLLSTGSFSARLVLLS